VNEKQKGTPMKVLIAPIIAALALSSAFPAAAQSNLGSGSGASLQLAAAHDSTADRETYTRKVQDDMQAWQQKLHAFGKKIRAKAKEAHNSAGDDKAWRRAEADTASSEDWDSATFLTTENRLESNSADYFTVKVYRVEKDYCDAVRHLS
jgi:hypothetical protein